jgi:hypothetical protein
MRAKGMIAGDPNAILVNAYNSVWVGFDEEGGYSIGGGYRGVAKRLRAAYRDGRCRATAGDVEALAER